MLDVVEEDMEESNAVRDPNRAELEHTTSVTSQSSSEGGGVAEPSSEGSLTSTPPSGSQSEGPPPAKPLTPRTSERKRKATGIDLVLSYGLHMELNSYLIVSFRENTTKQTAEGEGGPGSRAQTSRL